MDVDVDAGEIHHGQRHRHTIFRNMGAATMTLSFAKDLAKSVPVLLVVQQKDALEKKTNKLLESNVSQNNSKNEKGNINTEHQHKLLISTICNV